MKRLLFLASMALIAFPIHGLAETNVGISVRVGEPGFYGAIDIGNAPPPVIYSPQPVIIQPVPVVAPLPPLYLRVPPGHRKHWDKHCAEYDACGRQVYFVDDRWYNNVYVPHYQKHADYYQERREYNEKHEREWDEHGHGHGHGEDHDHERHD